MSLPHNIIDRSVAFSGHAHLFLESIILISLIRYIWIVLNNKYNFDIS